MNIYLFTRYILTKTYLNNVSRGKRVCIERTPTYIREVVITVHHIGTYMYKYCGQHVSKQTACADKAQNKDAIQKAALIVSVVVFCVPLATKLVKTLTLCIIRGIPQC